ncbi:DUF6252 family protein [Pedobacter sp. PF22-3]|uniref:DUF6252 family protein n=1 Tax=Pedobacter sp. PF22-3 TaxID=2994467 RepID=UPI002247EB0F|nr:DUF6252 family protein [Pedobacter sp. PF22-3]MCX2493344.1 DUF6252 family protein [Pedobacter sp. PF22-3]
MKLSFKLIALAFTCLLFISSCKKETPLPEKDIFSIKIDDTLIEFTDNAVISSNFTISPSDKMLRIIGNGSNRMINLNIIGYNGVGEYILNLNQIQVAGAYVKKAQSGENEENYVLSDGKVQILSVTDQKIKGTFHFIATDYSKTIAKTIDGIFYLGIDKQ